MSHYLVIEPSSKIRQIARKELKGRWVQAITAFLIVYVLTNVTAMLLNHFFAVNRTIDTVFGPVEQNLGLVGDLFSFAVSGAFSYGVALYLLTLVRTGEANNSSIFEGFSRFGKVFIMSLIIAVKIILWSLLFVIPGIIAAIRYSMSYYIMADNPEYTPMQCIEESKRIMTGNKSKYFWLTLSFIGWYILASIASSYWANNRAALGQVIIYAILYTPIIAVNLYRTTSCAILYEMINSNIVVSYESVYGRNDYRQNTCDAASAEEQSAVARYTEHGSQSEDAVHITETSGAPEKKSKTKNDLSELDSFGAPIDEKDDL